MKRKAAKIYFNLIYFINSSLFHWYLLLCKDTTNEHVTRHHLLTIAFLLDKLMLTALV